MKSSRFVIVIALLFSLVFPALVLAQFYTPPSTLSWDELVEHAGLKALKKRDKDQYELYVSFDFPPSIIILKSAIHLTPEEWSQINVSTGWQQLPPWTTDKMDDKAWKSTVQLGLPDDSKVDVDRLKYHDKAVILHDPDGSSRLYMLSPNADGKSGVLYYFYRSF